MASPVIMDPLNVSTAAVVVVAGQVAFKWIKYWYTKKTVAEKYIELANDELKLIERCDDYHRIPVDIDEVIEDIDIEPREKKRTKVKHRGLFRSFLVQTGKAKFGTPVRTAANKLCVRKFLYDQCIASGLLARHIVENLDFAVEAVFVPSRVELLAKAVSKTTIAERRREVSQELGGPLPSD